MTQAIAHFTKGPRDELDYTISWSSWLPSGDTVATATWTVPAALTQPEAPANTTTTATVWLGGGAEGVDYRVTCHVVTAAGRVTERSILIRVR